MQVQTQDNTKKSGKAYVNRSEVLEKALNIARKTHEIAIWTIRQSAPGTDYEYMAPFFTEWLRSEVKRLWNIDLLKEEVAYIWQKAVLGF
ncbi:MAG: hypothetical protein C0177_00760 [Fervidicoccus fontis]|nr:MAG: hypothetical protein C0177_00760 [Fervidicoccus fontis]